MGLVEGLCLVSQYLFEGFFLGSAEEGLRRDW